MHARRSYKTTRKIGKLLQEAGTQFAKFVVIIENEEVASVKDLDRNEQHDNIRLEEVPAFIAQRL